VQLAALAATLTSRQVTQYRAGTIDGDPAAASRLAGPLGRREEALAARQEGTGICRELATTRPDAFRPALATPLNNLAAGLDRRKDVLAASQEATGIRRNWP
jgi:hypothetical protein